MTESKGFFGMLFDLSFSEFVTIRVIKILFILAIICAGIISVSILVAGFAAGGLAALGALIFAPIVFLLGVIISRIWLEIVIVMFRIEENTRGAAGSQDTSGTA